MASDSDDEDLKAAIAMSLSASQSNPVRNDQDETKDAVDQRQPQNSAGLFGIAGMNRKAMEEERLARLSRKRERSISPPPLLASRKAPKLEESTVTLPSGAVLRSFSTLVDNDQQARKSDIANAANQRLERSRSPTNVKTEPAPDVADLDRPRRSTLKYPHGTVKNTWAFRHPRDGSDTKLEEVLEPATLRTAVLGAFQWDTDWLLSKLKTPLTDGSTKCVFVMQAKEASLRDELLAKAADWRKFLRLCFPSMEGQVHCMHSKLMLLFHADKLRVAAPTANLLNFDWGETGVMENSVFMIDLPRLPGRVKAELGKLTPFARELLYYLEKMGLDEDIHSGVLNFDFSATAGMAFVHTVGGAQYGDDAERTGLPGLAKAVRDLGLQSDEDLEIDFAASSIGSLNDEYLRSLHAAARGEDMFARAAAEQNASKRTKADFFKPKQPSTSASASKGPAKEKGKGIRDLVRIYFPTHPTVTASTAGAAGTICLSRKWYESSTFPRQIFRDYKSTREGLLSHNKILYARGKRTATSKDEDGGKGRREERKDIAWVYVGSANMSESAWGKVVFDRKAKAWKVNCRNWECGVLLPVSQDVLEAHRANDGRVVAVRKERIPGDDSETESEDDGAGNIGLKGKEKKAEERLVALEVFDGIVKPPCHMPGEKYEGREPWYFME